MAQDFAKDFYNSPAWKYCRASFKQSKRHLCERCLARGVYRTGEIVHHKVALNPSNINNPDITLNWANLQCLCVDCHAEVHKAKKRYVIDDAGKVIATE